MTDEIIIKICSEKDLELLSKYLPAPSKYNHHLDRLKRQKRGEFSYLIAWINEIPVGTIFINWKELRIKKVKDLLNKKPLIGGLFVNEEFRSKGIGTKLILSAQDLIKKKKFKYSSIAVGIKNPKARKLYEKLGYKEIEGIGNIKISWTIADKSGVKKREYETVNYLDKKL